MWQRDLKPTSNDDKISDTKSDDPSSKQIAEKNKKFKDELEAPQERAPLGDLRKKLLILDINGLLADIQSHTPKGSKADKRIAKRAGKDRLQNVYLLMSFRHFIYCFHFAVRSPMTLGKGESQPRIQFLLVLFGAYEEQGIGS